MPMKMARKAATATQKQKMSTGTSMHRLSTTTKTSTPISTNTRKETSPKVMNMIDSKNIRIGTAARTR
jgi:hypothetical protein